MSRRLFFALVSLIYGTYTILTNQTDVKIIIFSGVMIICSYMLFQGRLGPNTNILSRWMTPKGDRERIVGYDPKGRAYYLKGEQDD